MPIKQVTIKEPVKFNGVGIHSGESATLVLKPAPENYGIRFLRTDILNSKPILAIASNVVRTDLSVTLGDDISSISTVEHLLSALHALGINNLHIEIDGPEVPILDGSSKEYIEALVGNLQKQSANVEIYKVTKPVVVRNNDSFLYLLPADHFAVSCKIDFKHPNIGEQVFHMPDPDFASYSRNVALAKTFGFVAQLKDLQARGLAKGARKDNAIYLEETYIANPDTMTYEDEFVRHKILDLFGDLYLLGGKPLIAHVVAYKSGHALHTLGVQELLRTKRFVLTTVPNRIKLKDRKVWTLKDVIAKVF